jgi:hypothetical protein
MKYGVLILVVFALSCEPSGSDSVGADIVRDTAVVADAFLPKDSGADVTPRDAAGDTRDARVQDSMTAFDMAPVPDDWLVDSAIADASGSRQDASSTKDVSVDSAQDVGPISDMGVRCEMLPPLSECFRGAAFAECGGSGEPTLYCDPAGLHCMWFEGACAAIEFPVPGQCPTADQCVHEYVGYGGEPWDRTRAMVVPVSIGAVDDLVRDPTIHCECRGENCRFPEHLCNGDLLTQERHPGGDTNWLGPWSLPSLVFFGLRPAAGGEGVSWSLEIEVDFYLGQGPAMGRVCLIDLDDSHPMQPVCAEEGSAQVDILPLQAGDVPLARIAVDLIFHPANAPAYRVRGTIPPMNLQ